jgi:Mn-dependent DtxR family transcriptional regulator
MSARVTSPVPRSAVRAAFGHLVELGYATTDGVGGYDLTDEGRDWLLMAIWVRLGCSGFSDSWYERLRPDAP